MVEKRLNNTTPYGEIRASHEGSLHSSTLSYKPYQVSASLVLHNIHIYNTFLYATIFHIYCTD